jgi:hypothetical protein
MFAMPSNAEGAMGKALKNNNQPMMMMESKTRRL